MLYQVFSFSIAFLSTLVHLYAAPFLEYEAVKDPLDVYTSKFRTVEQVQRWAWLLPSSLHASIVTLSASLVMLDLMPHEILSPVVGYSAGYYTSSLLSSCSPKRIVFGIHHLACLLLQAAYMSAPSSIARGDDYILSLAPRFLIMESSTVMLNIGIYVTGLKDCPRRQPLLSEKELLMVFAAFLWFFVETRVIQFPFFVLAKLWTGAEELEAVTPWPRVVLGAATTLAMLQVYWFGQVVKYHSSSCKELMTYIKRFFFNGLTTPSHPGETSS